METSLVKSQYVISLRNGMIAYIVADNLESIASALQNNKFFNTKEGMMINTADIVAIMAPAQYEEQQKYQRGCYKNKIGTRWFNKKGEEEELTPLGERYVAALEVIEGILNDTTDTQKERAIKFIKKMEGNEVYPIVMEFKRLREKYNEIKTISERQD